MIDNHVLSRYGLKRWPPGFFWKKCCCSRPQSYYYSIPRRRIQTNCCPVTIPERLTITCTGESGSTCASIVGVSWTLEYTTCFGSPTERWVGSTTSGSLSIGAQLNCRLAFGSTYYWSLWTRCVSTATACFDTSPDRWDQATATCSPTSVTFSNNTMSPASGGGNCCSPSFPPARFSWAITE